MRSRAVNPRFIEGQMRHGARGAAELAETVDRLVDFAETTGKVASALFDLVHDAYLGDPRVREFLLRENPQAARAIAERLEAARRKGLWHPRRNDIDTGFERASGRRPCHDLALRTRRLPAPVRADADRRRPACAHGDGRCRFRSMQFARLCAAAREHGNGVIEISARGSMQVRGLTPLSAPLFAAAVASLDIALCDGVPVIANPLRGRSCFADSMPTLWPRDLAPCHR